MKKHPEMTVALILRDVLFGDDEAHPVGSDGSHEENLRMAAGLKRAIEESQVAFQCIGCSASIPAKDAEICACGMFVCPACCAVEEDGVCAHDPPDFTK